MPSPPESETLGLVAELYEAACDPGRWPYVVARTAALTRASGASLTFVEREIDGPWVAEPVVIGNACAQRLAAPSRGTRHDTTRHLPERSDGARGSDVVHAYTARPCGHAALVATAVATDGRAALELVLHRPTGHPTFDDAEVAWAERLLPHLARACVVRRRWRALAGASASRAAALDALGPPCVAVDASARVLWTNTAAALLLAHHDGLVLRDGRLGAATPDAEARLRAAVRRCASAGVVGEVAGMPERAATVCPRHAPAGPLAATVLPIRCDAACALVVIRACDALDPLAAPGNAASHDARWQEVRWQDAETHFHLTPAERRVAVLVCEGRTVGEIAATARVSAGTVRNHLKSVFAKTGVRRQAELVVRLLAGRGPVPSPVPSPVLNGTGVRPRSTVP